MYREIINRSHLRRRFYFVIGRQKINVREYKRGKMNNPEKLATYGRQDEDNEKQTTTQYVLDTTMRKGTQNNVNRT